VRLIITPEQYEAERNNVLTSSALVTFARCPMTLHQMREGVIRTETTRDMVVGTALHYMVQHRTLDGWLVGGPINQRTGRPYGTDSHAFRDWAGDSPALSAEEGVLVRCMYEGLRRDGRDAIDGLDEHEIAYERTISDVLCRCRADIVRGGERIIEVKTTHDLDQFEGEIRRRRYDLRAEFYSIVAEIERVEIIAVEKRAPYRTGKWIIGAGQREYLNAEARNLIREYRTTTWPSRYADVRVYGHDTITVLQEIDHGF
jgi:hypothetical protein